MHLLEGLFLGMRNSQQIVGQRQQLLALGALTAGLTHELNNPAAAAVRANAALRDRVRRDAQQARDAGARRDRPAAAGAARRRPGGGGAGRAEDARAHADAGVGARGRADRLARRPRRRQRRGSSRPIFVSAGTTTEFLDKLAAGAPPEMLEGAVRWLAYTLETELLLDEITDSVTRISTLVAAAKQYSHMDRAPFERADIHDGTQEHPGDDGRQARRAQRGEGARPVAAAGAGLRRRAEPGVDQPDRQRGAGDGRCPGR